MTIHFRRKLLAFFIALFFMLGISALYYSQGYRIDFSTWTIKKTGAVYIEGYQRPVDIYLNSTHYNDQSGFLKNGTLISSILPKKYQLTVTKNGFYTYEKNIQVEPSQVVRLFHALLVPTTIATTTITTGVQGNTITEVAGDGSFITKSLGTPTHYTAYSFPLPTASSTATDITASSSTFTKQKFSAVAFYPQHQNLFIGTSNTGLFRIDPVQKKITEIYSGEVDFYTTQGDTLYIIAPIAPIATSTATSTPTQKKQQTKKQAPPNPAGIIIASVSDPTQATSTERYPATFYGTNTANFEVRGQYQALLLKSGELFLYDTTQATTTQLSSHAKYFSFSPDGRKFLWQDTTGEVFVYMLDNDLEALNARQGDIISLHLIDTANIQHLWWYTDSYHLLLAYPNTVTLAEVSTIDPNNAFPVASGSYQDIAYVQQKNTLLLLGNDGTLTTINLDFSP